MTREMIKKNKVKIVNYLKIGIQVLCFVLMPSLFISIFQSMQNIVEGIVHGTGSLSGLMPDIILLLFVSIFTAFSGRFFCGWMCAFGSLGDFIYKIRTILMKKRTDIPIAVDAALKSIKYLLLFGLIVFVWGFQLLAIPSGVSPWDLFGVLMSFSSWPTITQLMEGWIPASIILLIILAGSFIIERFFCRYLCPLGAYFSIISRIRSIYIVKDREECGNCTMCTKKCSMGINLKSVDKVHSGECINCLECISNCPKSNAHYEIAEMNVNGVLVGTASCALIAGAVYLGNFYSDNMGTTSESTTTVSVSSTQVNSADSQWEDGTYEGTGTGFRGEMTVLVTILEGIITDIQIESTNDDSKYIDKAADQIISDIIVGQTADVDSVSGATYSSNGLIEAVSNALEDASIGNSSITLDESDSASEETDITDETDFTDETDSSDETDTQVQETEDEEVSEDTSDSQSGTIASVEDGTYEGSGTGFRGDTTVSVTVENGEIKDISILSYQDDERYFASAYETVIEEIISNQDVDVDAVSGATYSSNSIMAAVADALDLDYTQPTITSREGGHGGHK